MQTTIIVAIGLAVALAAIPAKSATKAPGKAAPACSAISFRPLPPGMPDGEQQAGIYKSRHGASNRVPKSSKETRPTIT